MVTGNPWQAGDFSRIAPAALVMGEIMCDEIPVYANQRVLDIGCGSGNTALAVARRRAIATGVDPVPKLLDTARARAAAEKLEIEWYHGSAEALPFPDASFDLALSTFGLIFSTHPAQAVAEAARVLTPGGKLAFTSWTTGGLNDALFAETESVLPEMVAASRAWGREADARALLAAHFKAVRIVERFMMARAPDTERWLAGMKMFLAPVVLAYEGLDDHEALAMDQRLRALGEAYPKAPNGTFFVRVPYMEFHCQL